MCITLRNRTARGAEFLGPEPAWEVMAAPTPWANSFMWSVRFCLSQPSLPHPRHLGLLRASTLPDPMPPCICSAFRPPTLSGWVPAVSRPVVQLSQVTPHSLWPVLTSHPYPPGWHESTGRQESCPASWLRCPPRLIGCLAWSRSTGCTLG